MTGLLARVFRWKVSKKSQSRSLLGKKTKKGACVNEAFHDVDNSPKELFNCSVVETMRINSTGEEEHQNRLNETVEHAEELFARCNQLRRKYMYAEARYMQRAEQLEELENKRFEAVLEGAMHADSTICFVKTCKEYCSELQILDKTRRSLRKKFLYEDARYKRCCEQVDELQYAKHYSDF